MKNNILYILIILFLGCKQANKSNQTSIHFDKDELSIKKDTIDYTTKEVDLDNDCIFDQATQTDDFLKGIKEFEGYIWDSETKTAEIVLNDHWGLDVKRGGCDHFEMSATFIYERVLDIEKDKDQIFNNIIWITSLLEDFDGVSIKEAIKNGKIVITKDDKFNFHVNFMDEKLYELYFMNFNNEKVTTFNIGYSFD